MSAVSSMAASSVVIELGEVREEHARALPIQESNLDYLVPGVAAGVWLGFWVALGCYVHYIAHDYEYPNNPIRPQLVEMAKKATISLGAIGGATIPIALVQTFLKAAGRGLFALGQRASATRTYASILKESIKVSNLGKRRGILINTLAAPFAAVVICAFAIANSD